MAVIDRVATAPNRVIKRISVKVGRSKAKEVERFIKFLIVGAIGAVIDLGLTNFFMKFVFHVQIDNTIPVLISAGIGFTAAVTSNFIWNRYWTYPDSRSRSIRRQLSQFFVVNAVGLGIRAIVLKLLFVPGAWLATYIFSDIIRHPLTENQAARLGANFAIMVALVIVMFWNFFVNRRWTYNDVK